VLFAPPFPGEPAVPADDRPRPADDLAQLGRPPDPWWVRLRAWVEDGRAGVGHLRSPLAMIATITAVVAVVAVATVWVVTGGSGPPSPTAGGAASLPVVSRTSGTSAAPSTGVAPGSSTPTTASSSWVAIAGAINRPGLYLVPADVRLSSLIAAAGGLTGEADGDRVNLAAVVRDGERVYVPRRGEPGAPPVVAGSGGAGTGGPIGGSGSASTSTGASGPSGPIDLNRAGAEELDKLPGVGPATAKAIVDYRTAHGPFTSVEQLADVRGIGPAKLDQLRPLVVV
jgi:competence protein ComEA